MLLFSRSTIRSFLLSMGWTHRRILSHQNLGLTHAPQFWDKFSFISKFANYQRQSKPTRTHWWLRLLLYSSLSISFKKLGFPSKVIPVKNLKPTQPARLRHDSTTSNRAFNSATPLFQWRLSIIFLRYFFSFFVLSNLLFPFNICSCFFLPSGSSEPNIHPSWGQPAQDFLRLHGRLKSKQSNYCWNQ